MLNSSEILKLFGDRYMVLHRENYLEEPNDLDQLVVSAGRDCSDRAIADLLASPNWRSAIIGTYCVLGGRRASFASDLRKKLLGSSQPLLRRPACLGLLILRSDELGRDCLALLGRPFADDLGDRAAALEALRILDSPAYAVLRQRTQGDSERVRLDGHMLAASQARFAAAVAFWARALD